MIGVERDDQEAQAEPLLERLLGYRIFSDPDGKMNLSLTEVGGGLLLVPQFTLPADTKNGMRPSFTPAASPEAGERLFSHLLARATQVHPRVASGRFGAHMLVNLTNDGPGDLLAKGRAAARAPLKSTTVNTPPAGPRRRFGRGVLHPVGGARGSAEELTRIPLTLALSGERPSRP